ncbi:MAG: nucleotide exchange factor GrpE [Oscillospiraceae bacterium]|nr:nucleotide exchange factor GrpE [Oscillospiraceae bacterium]
MAKSKKEKAQEAVEETVETVTEETAAEETEAAAEPSELELAEKAAKEANDKYLRLAAEYDNFRKRTAKEKESIYGDAQAKTIEAFLTLYDNLERAVANPSTDENYKKGVELIFNQLCETLAKLKVEILDPKGEGFDPNFHNAVMHEENEDYGENTVSEVFQKGAKLGDRVIRPAMVKVAN